MLERALEQLNASPLVGTMATRFMGRIVSEVLQANKAMADKLPGLGSLVSFGTSAASKVIGAADKQLEGLLGDTVGKGGQFAIGRLNRIMIDTIQDPTTREAVLQVWDLIVQERVVGLDGRRHSRTARRRRGRRARDRRERGLASEHVAELGRVVVAAFLERFGGYTPTELLDQLDLSQDELVADLVRLAPGVLDALRESGDLERTGACPARAVLLLGRGCPDPPLSPRASVLSNESGHHFSLPIAVGEFAELTAQHTSPPPPGHTLDRSLPVHWNVGMRLRGQPRVHVCGARS